MRRVIMVVLGLGAIVAAGCASVPDVGERPKMVSYREWGARFGEIAEIQRASMLCQAALVHHRNAHMTRSREKKHDEFGLTIRLLTLSKDQLYAAWDKYPEYEKFIVMELDKVYGFIHGCISQRPYYFDVIDPLNIVGGVMTYEQQLRVREYKRQLRKWTGVAQQ